MLAPIAANAATAAVTGLLDGGTVDLLAGSTLLVSLRLGNPAFSSPSDGTAKAEAIASGVAQATGTPTLARVRAADGSVVLEVSDVRMEPVTAGSDVSINAFTYTVPK